LRGQRVVKPRPVLWEWLLLSNDSPLRELLASLAQEDELGERAFSFLPTLRFYEGRTDGAFEVQRARLIPLGRLTSAERVELARIVGRSLALWSWLGVADLHWENLVLGRGPRGHLVFGPLDIEMILADLSLPTETKLLPDADPEYATLCRHAAGVRRVLPYLGKPVPPGLLVAMAAAYEDTLSLLDRHAPAIAAVLSQLPGLDTTPLRVLLRSTGDYVTADGSRLWPPLLDAELEQLQRGDIPYFFRLYGHPGIHYFTDPTLTQVRRLPLHGDTPQLSPLLDLSRDLRSPSRNSLLTRGLFALLAAFDHPTMKGRYEAERYAVTFGARSLGVTTRSGSARSAPRNQSAIVGSVYLPCSCGEVRSVFVPEVTRCTLRSPRGG